MVPALSNAIASRWLATKFYQLSLSQFGLIGNIMLRQGDAIAHLLEIDSQRQFSLLKKMPKGFLQNLHHALGRLLLNFERTSFTDQ
jgi:hypothetical protein